VGARLHASSAASRAAEGAAREQLLDPPQQHVDAAGAPRRPLRSDPVVEAGGAGDAEAFEEVAAHERRRGLVVALRRQCLQPVGVEIDGPGEQPHLRRVGFEPGTEVAPQRAQRLVERLTCPLLCLVAPQ